MKNNIDNYKEDLKNLISDGSDLFWAMQLECFPDKVKETLGNDAKKIIKTFPNFKNKYQIWYSEAKVLIKQLLPERLSDFTRHYEKPKPRKEITYENYHIEDYLLGISIKRGIETVVGPEAAIPRLQQQIAIVKSISARFGSTLFDIKQLVQADLFDSELDAARELVKNGFLRGAGAVAGVVLEKHLKQVADNHKVYTRKKHPTISDFNDLLKNGEVLDTPSWRQIQRLGDIRNLCDHNKDRDPTEDEVEELIGGVEKYTKTLF